MSYARAWNPVIVISDVTSNNIIGSARIPAENMETRQMYPDSLPACDTESNPRWGW